MHARAAKSASVLRGVMFALMIFLPKKFRRRAKLRAILSRLAIEWALVKRCGYDTAVGVEGKPGGNDLVVAERWHPNTDEPQEKR